MTGGCQCGAVRFKIERLGRASLCHCRMCQKAFGSFFGPLVDAHGLEWTRGAPRYFQSSRSVRRGFCGDCGTPLTYEAEGWVANVAIGALDHPSRVPPTIQVGLESKLAYVDRLDGLPRRTPEEEMRVAPFYARVVSRQHPDHDTDVWPHWP